MAKTWNAPVLEELSIPAGTYGSVDDPNGAQDLDLRRTPARRLLKPRWDDGPGHLGRARQLTWLERQCAPDHRCRNDFCA